MPTFGAENRFWREYAALSEEDQTAFLRAKNEFVRCLKDWEAAGCRGLPAYPKRLGIKQMVNRGSVMEMAWAPDGRCTWKFGAPRKPGVPHVIWRRIGTHRIYDDP